MMKNFHDAALPITLGSTTNGFACATSDGHVFPAIHETTTDGSTYTT